MTKNNTKRKNQGSLFVVSLICLFLFAVMSGCATTKPADFILAGFDGKTVESVTVLPVLDHRIDQTKQLKLDKWVLPHAERSLKKRGYKYNVEQDRSLLLNISHDTLEVPTEEFIKSLPPESARWVLILVLDDSSSKMTFGSTGNAEMSGYLFDKGNSRLAWRNKEIGRSGQGGLIGMALKGTMERTAIEMATIEMFKTLPSRKK